MLSHERSGTAASRPAIRWNRVIPAYSLGRRSTRIPSTPRHTPWGNSGQTFTRELETAAAPPCYGQSYFGTANSTKWKDPRWHPGGPPSTGTRMEERLNRSQVDACDRHPERACLQIHQSSLHKGRMPSGDRATENEFAPVGREPTRPRRTVSMTTMRQFP